MDVSRSALLPGWLRPHVLYVIEIARHVFANVWIAPVTEHVKDLDLIPNGAGERGASVRPA